MKFTFTAVARDGKAEDFDLEEFSRALFHFEGKIVEIGLKEYSSHKSRPYEKWYWGVVLDLASKHTGYTKDELHEINKARHRRRTATDPMTGKEITLIEGTSDPEFTMQDQFDFYDAVRRDYEEFLGLVIPDPNE